MKSTPITLEEIEAFKKQLKVGDVYKAKAEVNKYDGAKRKKKIMIKVTVQGIYPYFVQTDKGAYVYSEFIQFEKEN